MGRSNDISLYVSSVLLVPFSFMFTNSHQSKTFSLCMRDRSESLTAESRLVHASPSYRLIKSRSESDLSQPESDEEGYALVSISKEGSLLSSYDI